MRSASARLTPVEQARMKILALSRKLQARYESLAMRERLLIVMTGLALGASAWDFVVNQPMTTARAEQAVELERLRSDVKAQRVLAATLRLDGGRAEVEALHAAVTKARADLSAIEQRLQTRMAGFVPAGKAEQMLADVLAHYPGLSLVSAEVLQAEPLGLGGRTGEVREASTAPDAPAGSSSHTPLYKHGLRLELSGNYLDSLAYMRELEELPWGLSWDRVEYQISTHPIGRLVIEMHTISDREEWGGA